MYPDSSWVYVVFRFRALGVTMARFDLLDVEWGLIQPLLPNKPRGVARVDGRRVLNGIFVSAADRRILRDLPERDGPERYGPPKTISSRFNRWAKAGVWVRVFETLAERSPDSMVLIDSSILRAQPQPAAKKGGRITPSVVLVADRGDDARAVLELIPAHGGRGHMPTQRDRKVQRSVDPAPLWPAESDREVLQHALALPKDRRPL